MTRRIERGNVVGFVIIGIVLTALLAGGIWLAKNRASVSDMVANNDGDNKQSDVTKESGEKSGKSSDKTNNTDGDTKTESTGTTDEELKKTLNDQASKSDGKQDSGSSTNKDTKASTDGKDAADTLPETGPADTVLAMLGAGLLTASSLGYIRSRSLL